MKVLPNDIFFAEVERLLGEGGQVVLTVQGHSMRPFIRSGRTAAVLAPCDAQSLVAGDVVLFRYGGDHILHRIAAVEGDELVMAGDGNYRKFERCRREDVVARMVAVRSRSGRVTDCSSARWRVASRCWTALHPFVRRCILAFLWRAGAR